MVFLIPLVLFHFFLILFQFFSIPLLTVKQSLLVILFWLHKDVFFFNNDFINLTRAIASAYSVSLRHFAHDFSQRLLINLVVYLKNFDLLLLQLWQKILLYLGLNLNNYSLIHEQVCFLVTGPHLSILISVLYFFLLHRAIFFIKHWNYF